MRGILLDQPISRKAKMHCYYLNKEQYVKYFYERWKGTKWCTEERALKSWERVHKEKVDGVEYRKFEDYAGFSPKEECIIAKKYGIETVEELEWIDV